MKTADKKFAAGISQTTSDKPRITSREFSAGSALILAVLLTSMLAAVGVMFVAMARVNRISTSAISENKELDSAVETVIAKIAQRLVLDTPGVDPNDPNNREYYDYPDANNAWLASLEPYYIGDNGTPANPKDDYRWRQISDVTGYLLYNRGFRVEDVNVQPVGLSTNDVVREYPEIKVDSDGNFLDENGNLATEGVSADADGDGIADSKWIELDDITTSKGKPIYAAIRVIDNSAMLNVNTAYKFDPLSPEEKEIDGSRQTQINLEALARPDDTIGDISGARSDFNDPAVEQLSDYQNDVIWRIENPGNAYLPFDISDELELRYRYCIMAPARSRLENVWYYTTGDSDVFQSVPYDTYKSGTNPAKWRRLVDWQRRLSDPCDFEADRRHLLTAYNMDRVINPAGGKMVNVNKEGVAVEDLYGAILAGIADTNDANTNPDALAAQLAVNIKDFSDDDSDVTVHNGYHGFERPCVFISELVCKLVKVPIPSPGDVPLPPPGDVPLPPAPQWVIHRSYGIELRKRHRGTNGDDWQIVINGPNTIERKVPVTGFGQDASRYRVVLFQDPNAELESIVAYTDSPDNGETGVDPNVILRWDRLPDANEKYFYDVYFDTNETNVKDANNSWPVGGTYKGRQDYNDTSYDPYGPGVPMNTNTTYYWRIDDIYDNNDKNIIGTSGVWNFTTWATEPNDVNEVIGPNDIVFDGNSTIELQRDVGDNYITVDSVGVSPWLVEDLPAEVNEVVRSYKRDVGAYRWIKRLWKDVDISPSLGNSDYHSYPDETEPIQVRFGKFNNIGEIGMAFRENVYDFLWNVNVIEADVRIDLADYTSQQLFKYLTVFDPGDPDHHSGNDPNETRIKGRININTAPWYVIAQLPWVSKREEFDNGKLAKAIVAYRDKLNLTDEGGPDFSGRDGGFGFENIGQLNNVVDADDDESSIDYYALDGEPYSPDGIDQRGFPDLTTSSRTRLDGVANDFEERDLIFSRISDLVTVRSDVFTAYILVRIGTDGPQKRVIAILDRSGVDPVTGKAEVKIVALHPVPDPR